MKLYAITASINMDEEAIRDALAALGFVDIRIEQVISIDEYLTTLSSEPVEGLADTVSNWFRQWGNGGGDYSTECCARDACNTDVPTELAESIYSSIADYSKTPNQAIELIRDALDECLEDLKADNEEKKQEENEND